MNIWHVGASSSNKGVNGLNYTVWSVSEEQAKLGHHVSLLLEYPPDQDTLAFARDREIKLFHIPVKKIKYEEAKLEKAISLNPPDIIHFHSIFVPQQASLANWLLNKKIPYIITPNAISAQLLRRGWLKKWVYSNLVEKRRFYNATAITAVTPGEERAILSYVPKYENPVVCVPNPINLKELSKGAWQQNLASKKLVYLGRFDVLHKGIDILIKIASCLPEDIQVHLYGSPDQRTSSWLQRLQANMPKNVFFHQPVFGPEKVKVLSEASLYIQTSRWEVFGVSIAEAMYIGLPCVLTETLNLAEVFQQHRLGLVIPSVPKEAAKCIVDALSKPEKIYCWSKRAKRFAVENYNPRHVASHYLVVYEEAIK